MLDNVETPGHDESWRQKAATSRRIPKSFARHQPSIAPFRQRTSWYRLGIASAPFLPVGNFGTNMRISRWRCAPGPAAAWPVDADLLAYTWIDRSWVNGPAARLGVCCRGTPSLNSNDKKFGSHSFETHGNLSKVSRAVKTDLLPLVEHRCGVRCAQQKPSFRAFHIDIPRTRRISYDYQAEVYSMPRVRGGS